MTRVVAATVTGVSIVIALALAVSWVSARPRDSAFVPFHLTLESLELHVELSSGGVALTAEATSQDERVRAILSEGGSLREIASAMLRRPGLAEGATCDSTRSLDFGTVTVQSSDVSQVSVTGTSRWRSLITDDAFKLCLPRFGEPGAETESLTVDVATADLTSVVPNPDSITRTLSSAELVWNGEIPEEVEIRVQTPQSIALRRLPTIGPAFLFSSGPVATLIGLAWLSVVTLIVPGGLLRLRAATGRSHGDSLQQVDHVLGLAVALALGSIALSAWFQVDEIMREWADAAFRIVVFGAIAIAAGVTSIAVARRLADPWRAAVVGGTAAIAASALLVAATRLTENVDLPAPAVRIAAWLAVAGFVYIVLDVLADAASLLLTRRVVPDWVTVPLIGAALLLAAPSAPAEPPQLLSATGLMTIAVPGLSVLAAIAIALARVRTDRWEELATASHPMPLARYRNMVAILFPLLVVGSSGEIFGLPLGLLLAFGVTPLVLVSAQRTEVLAERAAATRRNRVNSVPSMIGEPETSDAADQGKVRPRARLGWISPFSFGPYSRPRHNAAFAVRRGAPLAGIAIAISLAFSLPVISNEVDPLVLLRVTLNVGAAALYWIGVAFVFGLGFEFIRGRTGVRKGLWMGVLAAAALGPSSLIDFAVGRGDALRAITDLVLLIAYLLILGLAFDLKVTRRFAPKVRGLRGAIDRVAETSGIREVTAVIIAVIAAVSLQLQAAIAGQLTTFLQSGFAALTQPR